MTFTVEPLGDHDLDSFDCGNDELNAWLKLHAQNATGQGTRTYVVIDEDGAVVGYFAIAPHYVTRDEVPRRSGRGAPSQIPTVLLAKLASERSLQGEGLGSELLIQALTTVLDVARKAGGRLVVVDAIDDETVAFYEHHDFEALPGQDRRLLHKLSTVAKELGTTWP